MSLEQVMTIESGRATLTLQGRIDREASAVLQGAYGDAASAGVDSVLLDFAAVEYINSTGIAIIVGLLGAAQRDGREVLAAGLTPHYQHIFEITRLSDFITVVDPVARRMP